MAYAATQNDLRITYQSRNNTTGLTDVKAQVYLNGVAKAVGGSAIVLTEVDATNSPGMYELVIAAATLTGWGVTGAGTLNVLSGWIDSVAKPAPSPFKAELTVANLDDIDSKLGVPATTTIAADIAAVKSDTASTLSTVGTINSNVSAIKADIETGPYKLQNILEGVQAIQNQAGFALPIPAEMLVPVTGSTPYRLPLTIYDNVNALVDPEDQWIQATVANQTGTDEGAYLTGFSTGLKEKQNITAVADVAGSLNNKYFYINEPGAGVGAYVWFNVNGAGVDPGPFGTRTAVPVAIATGASAATVAAAVAVAINALTGRFTATAVGAIVTVYNVVSGTTAAATDAGATGFTFTVIIAGDATTKYAMAVRDSLGQYHVDVAIPSTATVDDELIFSFAYSIGAAPTVRKSVTILVDNVATGGALQSTLLAVQTTVNTIEATVDSVTYGNAAIKTAVDGIQTDVTTALGDLTTVLANQADIEGTGFVTGTDSLHQLSLRIFTGGRAV